MGSLGVAWKSEESIVGAIMSHCQGNGKITGALGVLPDDDIIMHLLQHKPCVITLCPRRSQCSTSY